MRAPAAAGSVEASTRGVTPFGCGGAAAAFGALFNAVFNAPDPNDRRLQRTMLSMSWHRLALDEMEPLTRFLLLWFACEAVEPPLRGAYFPATSFAACALRRAAVFLCSAPRAVALSIDRTSRRCVDVIASASPSATASRRRRVSVFTVER